MSTTIKISSLFLMLLTSVAAKDVNIQLPNVPMAPVPVKVNVIDTPSFLVNQKIINDATSAKTVKFSNHIAPEFAHLHEEAVDETTGEDVDVGEVHNERVTAYLHAPLLTPSAVVETLESSGFTILKSLKIDKKGSLYSIVFTNDALIKLASTSGRGFASSLHVTIDKKNKLTSITNPIYVLAAFLQNDYDKNVAAQTLKSLRDGFKNLQNSEESLKFRVLKRYQFMAGMPKYQDMQVVQKLPSKTLLENARKSKKIVYEQKLLNGSTLLGVKLSKRTSKFIKKTGYQNAGLLPYPVLIENGEAKILDPKYYIAIMYPMLKMSQFMTIATVPGAINKEISKIFR